MRINKTLFGFEIVKTLKNGIVEAITIDTSGAGRVRAALALLFAMIEQFNMVEMILE